MSELARKLRGDREAVASGRLTLDRAKARAKLREFRLPDPHLYVLQFVRAASMMGATKIDFVVGPSTTVCAFDAVLEDGGLDDIWNVAFEERRTQEHAALHNLALGVASAQALNPEFIEIVSGSSKLIVREDDEELSAGTRGARTTITVTEKFRFGHITEFFESFLGDLPEARALRRACEYSLIDVMCNGVQLNTAWLQPGPTREEETADGLIKAQARDHIDGVQYVLLRDDILVGIVRAPTLFLSGCAVHNSRTASMDLTGLALRERPGSFPRETRSVYHRMLQAWLDRNSLSVLVKQAALEVLCEELSHTPADEVGAGTRELLASLLRDPMFRPAVSAGPRVALRTEDHAVIEYSTRRVDLPTGPEPIAYIPDSNLPEQLALAGYPVRDVTVPLSKRARKARNKARFDAQPARPSRTRPAQDNIITVRVGALTGHVETTKPFQNGAGHVRLNGRVLFEREGPIPYDVEIHGPVQPNEYFDNVDRDETFDEIAILMLSAARRLFGEFSEDPDRVTLLLNRIADGEFESDFLGLLGYGREEAAKFLAQHQIPRDLGDHRWMLREAGPLCDMKVFHGPLDASYSLRDLMESPRPPLLCATPHSSRALEASRSRPVILPTSSQERLVRAVIPEAEDVARGLQRESAESSLMARPVFRPRTAPERLFSQRVTDENYVMDMELLGGSPHGGSAEVWLMWRERLLARHRWSAPRANWRVVVRSDELRPVDTYDNVEEDELFEEIMNTFALSVSSALAGWRRSVREQGRLDARGWELYVDTTLRHDDVAEIELPAWRIEAGSWQQFLVGLDVLGESARRNERLRYTRPGVEPSFATEAGEVIAQLPASIDPTQLQIGPLAGVRMRLAKEHTSDGIRAFHQRAPRPAPLDGGLVLHRAAQDGFVVSTALVAGDNPPTHVVELIWQDRVVERVEGPDVANFRSSVQGDLLGPDPLFMHASAGRPEALIAAAANARDTIVWACSQLRGEASAELRAELLKIAVSNEACEDETWWEVLQNAPLLETPDGHESLAQRARRGAGSHDGTNVLDEVGRLLRVARGDRRDLVHEFTLAGLCWAEPKQEELCKATAQFVAVRRDHELVRAVEAGDRLATHFLASCVFTQINAYYLEISDADEVDLQGRLLGTNL